MLGAVESNSAATGDQMKASDTASRVTAMVK